MKIAGLDIATDMGMALWDTDQPRSAIMTGDAELRSDQPGDYFAANQIGHKIILFNRRHQPDYWVIEEPLGSNNSMNGKGNLNTLLLLHRMFACATGVLQSLNCAYGVVPVATWRVAIYGKSWRDSLPMVPKFDRWGNPKLADNGQQIIEPMSEKEKAVYECGQMGIKLPDKKSKSHNAAEAALLTLAWSKTKPQGNHSKAVLMELFKNTRQMVGSKR
jgi:hypothetical protein